MANTTSMDFDTSDLARLSVDLGKVPGKAMAAVEAVSAKAALNVKNRMAMDAETFVGTHAPYFHRAISYDRKLSIGSVEYEIGPDKQRRQGPLGNIFYFGTSQLPPVLSLLAPLEAEEPDYIKYLALAAAGALE